MPGRGGGAHVAEVLKVLVVLIFLPALPIAVGLNVLGIATRLSPLPGISDGGGGISGLVTLVYVVLLLGIGASAVSATAGGSVPVLGGAQETPTPEPTPTQKPAATPRPTPTATSTATPTATPTPTPSDAERRQMELEALESDYRSRVDGSLEDPSIQDTEILATEYRENDEGELVLWAVFWECRNADAVTDQRFSMAIYYSNAVLDHTGTEPDALRFYGVSDFNAVSDRVYYVPRENAEAVNSGSMEEGEYARNWINTGHSATADENATAYQLVADERGEAFADRAWNDKEDSPGGCPGRAEVLPENEREE